MIRMVKEIQLDRTTDTRERRTFEIEQGKVLSFRVQLEVRTKGWWKPVIRWDTAHGFVDCDRYNLQGEKIKSILNLSLEAGLSRAQNDLNRNWHIYRQRFLEGLFP